MRLHDLAERHRTIEKLRGAQDYRQDGRNVAGGLRDECRLHILDSQGRPSGHHSPQRAGDPGPLFFFAADQGNALTVFAKPCENIAILGLGLILGLRHLNEATADERHRPTRNRCVQ